MEREVTLICLFGQIGLGISSICAPNFFHDQGRCASYPHPDKLHFINQAAYN